MAEPARDASDLMFGQSDAAEPRGRTRMVLVIAAGLALAAAGGYVAYARSVPDPVTVVPGAPPTAPVRQLGQPAEPLPVPSAEEIATLNELFPPVRRAPTVPVEPPGPSPNNFPPAPTEPRPEGPALPADAGNPPN